MKPLVAVFSARFRLLLQYRAAAFAGFVTQVMWGFLLTMGLAAFYRSSDVVPPLSLSDAISYIWLGQAIFVMLPWSVDQETRQLMRTGNVAYELLRPVDLHAWWFARALALRSAPALLRGMPLFVIAWLWFGLELPPNLDAGIAAVGSMVGALALSAAITVIVGSTLFWTVSGEGMTQLLPVAMLFFSGNVLPLPLFPEWTQPILTALPFRGIMDAPLRLYTGHIPASGFWLVAAHQWGWTIALIFVGRGLLHLGLRRLVVQGG
jgi:ABC-2 type transport system permease protein